MMSLGFGFWGAALYFVQPFAFYFNEESYAAIYWAIDLCVWFITIFGDAGLWFLDRLVVVLAFCLVVWSIRLAFKVLGWPIRIIRWFSTPQS